MNKFLLPISIPKHSYQDFIIYLIKYKKCDILKTAKPEEVDYYNKSL